MMYGILGGPRIEIERAKRGQLEYLMARYVGRVFVGCADKKHSFTLLANTPQLLKKRFEDWYFKRIETEVKPKMRLKWCSNSRRR